PQLGNVRPGAAAAEPARDQDPAVGKQDLVPRGVGVVVVEAGRGLPGSGARVVDLRGGSGAAYPADGEDPAVGQAYSRDGVDVGGQWRGRGERTAGRVVQVG